MLIPIQGPTARQSLHLTKFCSSFLPHFVQKSTQTSSGLLYNLFYVCTSFCTLYSKSIMTYTGCAVYYVYIYLAQCKIMYICFYVLFSTQTVQIVIDFLYIYS